MRKEVDLIMPRHLKMMAVSWCDKISYDMNQLKLYVISTFTLNNGRQSIIPMKE